MKTAGIFVVLYRWRLRPDREREFAEAWSEVTRHYLENFDSMGSRLHLGSDGIWYAYAQWHTEADRRAALPSDAIAPAREVMRNCVLERFPEVNLEIVSDELRPLRK